MLGSISALSCNFMYLNLHINTTSSESWFLQLYSKPWKQGMGFLYIYSSYGNPNGCFGWIELSVDFSPGFAYWMPYSTPDTPPREYIPQRNKNQMSHNSMALERRMDQAPSIFWENGFLCELLYPAKLSIFCEGEAKIFRHIWHSKPDFRLSLKELLGDIYIQSNLKERENSFT